MTKSLNKEEDRLKEKIELIAFNKTYGKNLSYYYFLPAFISNSFYYRQQALINTYLLCDLFPERNYIDFFVLLDNSDKALEIMMELKSSRVGIFEIYLENKNQWLVCLECTDEERVSLLALLDSKYSKMHDTVKQTILKNTFDPSLRKAKNSVLYPSSKDIKDFAAFFNVGLNCISELGPSINKENETFNLLKDEK